MERTPLLDAIPVNRPATFGRTVLAYIALTKPRIIELLLVTTIPTMFVAKRGVPGVWLIASTLIGGILAAGGANAINMYVDRDIDALMDRTKGRPLVVGAMSPRAALTFAISIEVFAFAWLTWQVNLLSAVLAVSACLFYVFIYTLWLKRTSEKNVVIGGAAGAVPVLVGWSAVTNSLSWAPVLLFFVIFVWTPPHTWALAVKYTDDYRAAGVPMMPVVSTFEKMANQIIAYTVVMWLATLLFVPVGKMGPIYGVTAFVLGAIFLGYALRLRKIGMAGEPTIKPAMRLFGWSITYVTILFGVMILDQLV
jgi:heme o synthase